MNLKGRNYMVFLLFLGLVGLCSVVLNPSMWETQREVIVSPIPRAILEQKLPLQGHLTSKFSKVSGLKAIVTGIEHSGTTVFSSIMFGVPCSIGAMETGFLLAPTPADIERVYPWYDWNKNAVPKYYGLTDDDYDALKKAPNFAEMYQTLRQRSDLFRSDKIKDESYCPTPYGVIDKTPRYVYPRTNIFPKGVHSNFSSILAKTPGVPCIVLKKDFDSQLKSSKKHGNKFLTRSLYDETYNEVERMKGWYPERIMVVNYTAFIDQPDAVMQEVFHHFGWSWNPSYLNSGARLGHKFQNYQVDWDERTMFRGSGLHLNSSMPAPKT